MSKRRFMCTPDDLARNEVVVAEAAANCNMSVAELTTLAVNNLIDYMVGNNFFGERLPIIPDTDTTEAFDAALNKPNALNLHYAVHHFNYQMLKAHYSGIRVQLLDSGARLLAMENSNDDCAQADVLKKVVQPWEAEWIDNKAKAFEALKAEWLATTDDDDLCWGEQEYAQAA